MQADIRSGSTRAGPCCNGQFRLDDSSCLPGDCTPDHRQQIAQFFKELVQVIETVTQKPRNDSPQRPLLDQES